MKIKTKYDIDQKVITIDLSLETVEKIPCTFCNSIGKIIGNDKTSATCPVCSGLGHESGATIWSWEVDNENVRIRSIEIFRRSINYKFLIGGRNQMYREADIFLTYEEAQAECDKRNKKKKRIE